MNLAWIIALSILVILCGCAYWINRDDIGYWMPMEIVSVFAWIIFYVLLHGIIATETSKVHAFNNSISIIAVRNSASSVHGSFLFGSGSFGSAEEYIGYTKNEYGRIKQVRFNAVKTYIIEDSSPENARAEYYFSQIDRNHLFIKLFWLLGDEVSLYKTEIHVPKGTVVRQIEIK